jgi:hypothetical protein
MRSARILLFMLGTFSIAALAGTKQYVFTTIDLNGDYYGYAYAYAAMGQARYNYRINTSDFGFMRCQFTTDTTISCTGYEQANNASFACSVNAASNPGFARNAQAINSASLVEIFWSPANPGVCTDMRLIQGSQFLPDTHTEYPAVSGISIDSVSASGALPGVRYNDSNPNEFISCDIWASGYIYCMARNQANAVASCSTTEAANPTLAAAVRSIDSISSVRFTFDASNVCTSVLVDKNTNNLP